MFAIGLIAGTAVTLVVLWLRWQALIALFIALLSGVALTATIVQEATTADGLPPTRYDTVVIAIGASLGTLIPAVLLTSVRWINRQVEEAKRLVKSGEAPTGDQTCP